MYSIKPYLSLEKIKEQKKKKKTREAMATTYKLLQSSPKMAVSRRSSAIAKQSKKVDERRKAGLYGAVLYGIPAAIFLTLFMLLWSSSTSIVSRRFIHVCVSSRKLTNLYCLSAGSRPDFEIPVQVVNHSRPELALR